MTREEWKNKVYNIYDSSVKERYYYEYSEYFEEIDKNVWLMDNHKWAFFVWENYFKQKMNIPENLIHIDYHWDDIDDFCNDSQKKDKFLNFNIDEIKDLIKENKLIRYDSFIAPAIKKGYFSNILFYCKQTNSYFSNLRGSIIYKVEKKQIECLITNIKNKNFVLDIDLDFFNIEEDASNSANNHIANDEIENFINKISILIKKASLITIALSSNCSGGREETANLASFVLPKILNIRKENIKL